MWSRCASVVRDLRNARNPQGGSANGIPLKAKTPDAGSKKPLTGPFAVVTVASWVLFHSRYKTNGVKNLHELLDGTVEFHSREADFIHLLVCQM